MDPQQQQQQAPLPPPPPAAPSSPSQQPQQQQPQQQFPMQPQPGFIPRGFPNQPRGPVLYYGVPQQFVGAPQGIPFVPPMYMQYPPPPRGMVYRASPQQFMPPQPVQPQLPPQPIMQQPQAPPQPYKKREKKPLLIVDPKTNTTIEIKAVQPASQTQSAVASPALTPAAAPVTSSPALPPQQAPVTAAPHHPDQPTPAEEMRQKALLAKASASPAPSMADLTSKMESMRIEQMPEVQLPGPRTVQLSQAAPPHMQMHPAMGMPPQHLMPPQMMGGIRPVVTQMGGAPPAMPQERKESPPVSAPPPLVVSATPAIGMPVDQAAEERKAKLKRDWEEKRQKALEIEQKEKEETARKEEEAKRTEETKRKEQQGPPSFSNVAARSLNEPKPHISLPLPTPVVPSPQTTPTNATANGGGIRQGERIVYSKDDLMAFRNSEACQRPPADLHPDFQDFQPRARQHRPVGSKSRDGAAAPPRVGSAGGPPQVGADWRNKPPGAAAAATGPAVPPLKTSSNAWKRTPPTSEEEATIRKVRSILNKLAKDNFDSLSRQILEIPITSRRLLEDVIQEIFDKALMEPSFGPVYAQLCKEISEKSGGEWDFVSAVQREGGWFWTSTTDHTAENCFNGPDRSNPEVGYGSEVEAMEAAKKANAFKRLLLNTCQNEFEKNSFKEVDEEEKEIRESGDVNSEEVKQKLQQVEMKRRKVKKRVLGNIAFIGELFLKKMLSAKIINTCIIGLLGEEAIQSPDTFFDPEKKNEVAPEDIECICKLFQTVGKEMDQADPATVDTYFKFLTMLERHLAKSDRPELRTSRQRFMIKDILELRQNRWQEKRETLKVSTKEEVRQKQAEQEVVRGGGGGGGGYQDRQGGGGRGYPQGGRTNPPPSGRFQQNAPSAGGGSVPRAAPQSNRFSQTVTTSRGPQPGLVAVGGPSSAKSPAPPVVGGVPRVGGAPTIATKSPAPPPSVSATPPPAAGSVGKAETITEDKLKTSFGSALDEYLVNQNVGDLTEEIRSLCGKFESTDKAQRAMVTLMVERIIEKKDTERQSLTKLMSLLVSQQHVLSVGAVVDALTDYLEFLNDIIIDSPKAGTHLATLLKELSESGALSLAQVSSCLDKLKQESPEGAEQFAQELQQAFGKDSQKVSQILKGSGSSSPPSNDWEATFSQMVREGKPENEIVQFLSTCPRDEIVSRGPELVDSVFEHVARKAGASQGAAGDAQIQSERQQVIGMKNVLKRLLQNSPSQNEHQVRALASIVSLAKRNQAPGDFVRRLFELLYREEIVSEEALTKWRDQADKADQEACAGFFLWLTEAQAESNDE